MRDGSPTALPFVLRPWRHLLTESTHNQALEKYRSHFGSEPTIAAFAPGRIEVLGNHVDYNDGVVLSAAIDLGTVFLAAHSDETVYRVVAGDLMEESAFLPNSVSPATQHHWGDYVKGVVAKLALRTHIQKGCNALFFSNIPLASGLSSSAALEVSAMLALASLNGIEIERLELAKLCQTVEHEFAGVQCGLLDQISSLYGQPNAFVMTDFRSLDITTVSSKSDAQFLVCSTGVKHTLAESAYNDRRIACEEAAAHFASVLDHPVEALRDVSWEDWKKHSPAMDPTMARRAAHIVGENARAIEGSQALSEGNLDRLGELMYESHQSSRENFENSCAELDFIVDTARSLPGTFGARLSGGGFGGSAIVLVDRTMQKQVGDDIGSAYVGEYGTPCAITSVTPSGGARLVDAS